MNNGYFKEVGSPMGNTRLPGVVVLGGAPPEPPTVKTPVVEPVAESKDIQQQDVVLNLNNGIATIGPVEEPLAYLKNLRLFLIAQLSCVEDAIKSYGVKRLKESKNESKNLPCGETGIT